MRPAVLAYEDPVDTLPCPAPRPDALAVLGWEGWEVEEMALEGRPGGPGVSYVIALRRKGKVKGEQGGISRLTRVQNLKF